MRNRMALYIFPFSRKATIQKIQHPPYKHICGTLVRDRKTSRQTSSLL